MLHWFRGPDGVRAGWKALLFAVSFILFAIAMRIGVSHLPAAAGAYRAAKAKGVILPAAALVWESIQTLVVVALTAIFLRLEHRPWRDCGLPWNEAFRSSFWLGAVWGFAALSAVVAGMSILQVFSFRGFDATALEALRYGAEWAIVFLLVAASEELLFRGYLLQTLWRGMGFWPAAVVVSLTFGAVHLQNINEGWIGALQVALAGLVFAIMILRTGTLWFSIGFHAAWDYGQSFVYSVADSGLIAKGHLLRTTTHGPAWLSGGPIGPEGSAVCTLVLIALVFLVPRTRNSRQPAAFTGETSAS